LAPARSKPLLFHPFGKDEVSAPAQGQSVLLLKHLSSTKSSIWGMLTRVARLPAQAQC